MTQKPPTIKKVNSAILGCQLYIVPDKLHKDKWPTDSPVYMESEVKLLRAAGSDCTEITHMVKELFNATITNPKPGKLPRRKLSIISPPVVDDGLQEDVESD